MEVLDTIHFAEKHKDVSLAMGINLVKPQKIQTACGKGYWECKEDETPFQSLVYPSINYFRFESANSIFYWSKKEQQFKRIWQSD